MHSGCFAGVYADKAITGTKVDKREDFQRLIQDCMDGKIDMVIAKSLPRFARNTLDTLKYVQDVKGTENCSLFWGRKDKYSQKETGISDDNFKFSCTAGSRKILLHM